MRELSNKPANVRSRLRQHSAPIARDMHALTSKPLDQWDLEELQRGRPRDANGKFPAGGARPKWITTAVLKEAQERLRTMGLQELAGHTQAAIRVLIDLMENSRVDMVRYKSAEYVLNQMVGLPTMRVELETSDSPVAQMLASVMRNPDGQFDTLDDDADIIDSEQDEGP